MLFFYDRDGFQELLGIAVPLFLRLDSLQEGAYRHLMRLYAARGDRGAISRTYHTCTSVLKRELAIESGLTTRKTYERLMRAED